MKPQWGYIEPESIDERIERVTKTVKDIYKFYPSQSATNIFFRWSNIAELLGTPYYKKTHEIWDLIRLLVQEPDSMESVLERCEDYVRCAG